MNRTYIIDTPSNFEINQIFDCGQCFRFNPHPIKQSTYCGVAFSKYLEVTSENGKLLFNCSERDFSDIWRGFFDWDTDYTSVIDSFSDDEILYKAANFSKGIRILNQDPWETLCSFIISQNNNIPRIKGIIENMSCAFGQKIECTDGIDRYAFPTAEALYKAGEEKIFSLKTGFRAKYIYDCAEKVYNGKINLESIRSMATADALDTLQSIKGVGPKVASCALLFGFSKHDAFPVDVWVKKIMSKYYSEKTSSHFNSVNAGIAQQYLFYYERCINNVFIN